jgi:hypothetical protein
MGSCCSIPHLQLEEEPQELTITQTTQTVTTNNLPEEPSLSPADRAESLFQQAKSLEKQLDYVGALSLFEQAGELGHGRAAFRAAYALDMGQRGVLADPVRAAHWYRRAAESGESKAAYSLGLCYAKGVGVNKDEAIAAKWFARAADAGYERALYNLGYCYERGAGVQRDSEKAVQLYKRAAELGSEMAIKRLEIFGVKLKK